MKFTCEQCGREASQPTGAVNRARRKGMRLFCGRACAGKGKAALRVRPLPGTPEFRTHKSAYDLARRTVKGDDIRAQKRAAYHARIATDEAVVRAEQKAQRELNHERHAAYCRTPEYRAWKSEYDRRYRPREFGEFAEAHMALVELQGEIDERITREEVYAANGIVNKKQTRRREYEAAQRI